LVPRKLRARGMIGRDVEFAFPKMIFRCTNY
jgi:hypothetical protein